MCILSTEQILQSGLRVDDNKSHSIFYNKFGDTILSATSNLWDNIQIIRTCILKHNIPNNVSLTTRYLNFETSHHFFGHTSDKVICHILSNDNNIKKIYFPTQKYVYHGCTLRNIH